MPNFDDLIAALSGDPEYVPTGQDRIPVELWGKDHWSTFAYLETRIVDHGGRIAHDHMRCHGDRHPFMLAAKRRCSSRASGDGRRYPTRLKDGWRAESHDDYDCIDDMIAAGLVTVQMPDAPEGVLLTGLVESELMAHASYGLTELGWWVAGQLRAHKGAGGNFASFAPQL